MLAAFGFLATTPVGAFLAVFLLGGSGSFMMPALQTRLMDVAAGGQSLAAALMHSTLNVANAVGAWLGGAVLAAGYSYAWPSRVSVVLPVLGIIDLRRRPGVPAARARARRTLTNFLRLTTGPVVRRRQVRRTSGQLTAPRRRCRRSPGRRW